MRSEERRERRDMNEGRSEMRDRRREKNTAKQYIHELYPYSI